MSARVLALGLTWPGRDLALRAGAVTGAYLFTAGVSVGLILALRQWAAPSALRSILAFVFVSTLVSGIDPGGARAQALRSEGAFAPSRGAYLVGGGLKALLAAPLVALLWRLGDRQAGPAVLVSTPLLCAAGFWTTDLRVLLDLRGRHVWAIGLKQGSLSAGHAIAGIAVLLGGSLPLAVGLAAGVRAVAALAVAALALDGGPPDGWLGRMLGDRRWVELAAASVLGAAAGSADRVIGLRLLSPVAAGGYFLTSEALTRFWLLPFLIGPVLFARTASGHQGERLLRTALAVVLLLGVAMVVGVALVLAAFGGLWRQIVGLWAPGPTLVLAVGVVVGAAVQLRMTQLQARGRATRVLVATAVAGVVGTGLYLVLARRFGAGGLMIGVALRAMIELTLVLPRFGRGPSRGAATAMAPPG